MIKPNWDIFKAKFSENPQYNFEWFCYLLFCKEFNQPHGIFRYKNQSVIETNPIEKDKDVIGWQAKFYDTSLSNHKDDLLSNIEKAKRDYSNITKLLFYTNQEWGQNKGQKPKGLKEIEEKAKELNIELEWRTASFFECEFVSIENEVIAKHFFTLNKSIFALIEEQKKHTENILNEIQTSITFKDQNIEIDRKEICKQLKNKSQQIFILSGIGGVGKTAVIKNLYGQLQEVIPFYIFKATEFELRNINDLLTDFDFQIFAEAHKNESNKIIVIDSAEKLLDLKNTDPFKEFLSTLIANNWKIIFTTRNNYLEDLNYEFFEIYSIAPLNINIHKLELKEINSISEKYHFELPKDEKVLDLIKNPFYLNEYLKFYSGDDELDYSGFKNKLWNKNIKKAKPAREQCFLQIAFKRANEGQFFIIPNCESSILDDELTSEGILGYETAGYFITHDIYEEWALEKIIENEFIKRTNNQELFKEIGQSLPIRRSFRNWLSEKLLLEDEQIKRFIEEVLESNEIESFWNDEILISVLLSDYSERFFNIFKKELLTNNQELFKKLTFLLSIACKEVDEDFFKQLGMKNLNLFSLKHISTKPKGQGWESLIKFIFKNLDTIGIENIHFVLPIIHDWNIKFKEGETTKRSSLIALQYYQWHIKDDVYFSRDDIIDHLLQTIVYGAPEIKDELKIIFEEIVKNKWKNHRDPYYDLSKVILTKLEGITVSKVLPKNVLQLADMFWSYPPKENRFYSYSRTEVEQYFGLESNHSDYHPASAYQTPIYWLLKFSPKETVDFILEITNKAVKTSVDNNFDESVEEIEVSVNSTTKNTQYISHCLWNMYRGTGSPVTPYLLQSIHMALEKQLLDIAKTKDTNVIESWLIYLIKNSTSASITAVVTSVVLAYPDKFFNVAKILFRTSKFFLYDNIRVTSEHQAKDDSHRKTSLENLALNYQFFRSEKINEEEAEHRQKVIWDIIDDFYKQLPNKSKETDDDKTLGLLLARIDRRKMKPSVEQQGDKLLINLNPQIDPDLKKHSEEAQNKYNEQMRYVPLKLWATYKFDNNQKYGDYEQYEKDPKLVLKETKEIVEGLKNSKDRHYHLFNNSIPAFTCSALIREYEMHLSLEEKQFCRDIVIEYSTEPFRPNYQYQISDGVEVAVNALPYLFNLFPEDKNDFKIFLLFILFDSYPIGQYKRVCDYTIESIVNNLWDISPKDANDIFLGFLKLKPLFDNLINAHIKENRGNFNYRISRSQILKEFTKKYESDLDNFLSKELMYNDINISTCSLEVLETAFQLISVSTKNDNHLEFIESILPIFSEKLLFDDEKIDYSLRHRFCEKFSYFILNRETKDINQFIQPFVVNYSNNREMASFFQEIISTEDRINKYEQFWLIWESFYQKIVDMCNNNANYYLSEIIHNYLLAWPYWKDTTKEWHSLKEREKLFYQKVVKDIGHCPSVLDSIAKLLNEIGSRFLNDGIYWISDMLYSNKNLLISKLETNTIYYLENLVRKYIYKNREKVRKIKKLKEEVLIILDFLIEKGSVVGYMLRESIL
jgi:hypothetical protein